ncbi:MAG: hypothetical protein ACTSYA_02345 [Candidatus Kariarchaeaceae archaeon]
MKEKWWEKADKSERIEPPVTVVAWGIVHEMIGKVDDYVVLKKGNREFFAPKQRIKKNERA